MVKRSPHRCGEQHPCPAWEKGNTCRAFSEATKNQSCLVPPYKPRAKENKPLTLEELREISQKEARYNEEKLRTFFKDPYNDGSERWWLAEFALDYLREFKPDGGKPRKDKHTENIMHELTPALALMDFLQNKTLPRRVTYQVISGQKIALPEPEHSIENIFIINLLHDTKEDYRLSTDKHFKAYMLDKVNGCPDIPEAEEIKIKKQLSYIKKARHSITYDYKRPTDEFEDYVSQKKRRLKYYYEPERDDKDQLTGQTLVYPHGKDHTKYGKNMEDFWAAVSYKPLDRIEGEVTRYGIAPDYFRIEQDQQYERETRRLYMFNPQIENMADRYPQLKDYLEITNSIMNITYRGFAAMTEYHPSAIKESGEDDIHTETAQIDIERWIPKAIEGGVGERFLVRMLHGFEMEAQRYPKFQNLTKQIRKQLSKYMEVPPCPVAMPKERPTPTNDNTNSAPENNAPGIA